MTVVIDPFRTAAMERRRRRLQRHSVSKWDREERRTATHSLVPTKDVLMVRNFHTSTPVIIASAAAHPDSQTAGQLVHEDAQLVLIRLTRDVLDERKPSCVRRIKEDLPRCGRGARCAGDDENSNDGEPEPLPCPGHGFRCWHDARRGKDEQIPHHARQPDLHDRSRYAGAHDIDGDAPRSEGEGQNTVSDA